MSKIVIFGPDGGGKSTLATALGFEVRSYATPVKAIAHDLMGRAPIDRADKEENFRELYRTIGERAKELEGESVWVLQADYSGDNWVFDDGRFLIELETLPDDVMTVYCNQTNVPESTEVGWHDCDFYINPEYGTIDVDDFIKTYKKLEPKEADMKYGVKEWIIIAIFLLGMVTFITLAMRLLLLIWQLL